MTILDAMMTIRWYGDIMKKWWKNDMMINVIMKQWWRNDDIKILWCNDDNMTIRWYYDGYYFQEIMTKQWWRNDDKGRRNDEGTMIKDDAMMKERW